MNQKGAVSERDVARVLAHMNDTGGYCPEDEAVIGDVDDVLEELESRGWVLVHSDGGASMTPEGVAAHACNILRRTPQGRGGASPDEMEQARAYMHEHVKPLIEKWIRVHGREAAKRRFAEAVVALGYDPNEFRIIFPDEAS